MSRRKIRIIVSRRLENLVNPKSYCVVLVFHLHHKLLVNHLS